MAEERERGWGGEWGRAPRGIQIFLEGKTSKIPKAELKVKACFFG